MPLRGPPHRGGARGARSRGGRGTPWADSVCSHQFGGSGKALSAAECEKLVRCARMLALPVRVPCAVRTGPEGAVRLRAGGCNAIQDQRSEAQQQEARRRLKQQQSFQRTQKAKEHQKWSLFYKQAWFWCVVSMVRHPSPSLPAMSVRKLRGCSNERANLARS